MERLEGAASWGRLLERLAADHEALVDDFLQRLSELGAYDGAVVDHDDLRTTAGDTLEMLITRLAGAPLPERLQDLPARLGARRARQGVERESLLEAVRLDFRVLWAGMQRALGDAPADILVLHAEEVLGVVERYIGDVQVAFLDEQAALARDSRIVRGRALGRLLVAGRDAAQVAARESGRLQLALDGTFDVICVPTGLGESLRRALAPAPTSAVVVWDLDDVTIAVRDAATVTQRADASALLTGGIVRGVHPLSAVASAAHLAREIARRVEGEVGLADERALWMVIAHDQLADHLPSIAAVRQDIERLPGPERERVIETVLRVCSTGSIKTVAGAMFVHRNTVVNRLATFRAATGLDVSVPEQAAVALIGLGRRPLT